MRSFIAVDVTSPPLLERISLLQAEVSGTGADLKLLERENLHFTLRFLGDIDSRTVESLKEGLTTVRFTPFPVTLQGLGAFPNLRRMNVVWLGVVEGVEGLRGLQTSVEEVVRRLGFRPDPKGFSPHLTIARVRTGRNRAELSQAISKLSQVQGGSMTVNTLRLKASTLTPQGPIYRTLHEVPALG